jgi:phosphatidylcholine synthase
MNTSVVAAWGVHLYTAFGAVIGLFALEASWSGNYGPAFTWMGVALFIDCTDGTLARRMRVKQVLPHFDGAKLDDIVDYLNYVVVPVVLAYHAGLLPSGLSGLLIGSAPLIASGYGFSQTDAKTADHFFKGFPSYWNVVVFYFYTLRTPIWFNVAALVLLSFLVFVPIRYVYPSRTPTARHITYLLGGLWGVAIVFLLAQFPAPARWLAGLSLFFPAYYMAMSLHLHFRHNAS